MEEQIQRINNIDLNIKNMRYEISSKERQCRVFWNSSRKLLL